jgi:hypothetical protein
MNSLAALPLRLGQEVQALPRSRIRVRFCWHKSIATTQAYIDVNDEMKRAAVELMG